MISFFLQSFTLYCVAREQADRRHNVHAALCHHYDVIRSWRHQSHDYL